MKWLLILLTGFAIACAKPSGESSANLAGGSNPSGDSSETEQKLSARFERVIWIVFENTNYSGAMKNSILKNFADQGIQFDKMMAETHPSQGNYIAMIAGDQLGVNSDKNFDLDPKYLHIGNLLEKKGMDWRVYAEGYPGNCFLGARSGKYARKHVPFLSFLNVTQSSQSCAKVVNASTFQSDWDNHRLAHFNMYVPDLDNDGHDTGVTFAADWFQKTFANSLKDSRLMEKTLLILTFDESEGYFGGNNIYTAMISPGLPSRVHVKAKHTHYSLLKMIEDEWDLGNLGRADAKASVIQELQVRKKK